MNNGTIVCKRTLTKANEVLETVSLSLFPSVHHSSVFAINKQPSTSLLRHLFFSHSTLACQAACSVYPKLARRGEWRANGAAGTRAKYMGKPRGRMELSGKAT
jgi:hypothetical protein